MLTELLIYTFKDGEWFMGIIFWILFIGLLFLLLGGIALAIDEYEWSQTPVESVSGKLLNQQYDESTLEAHAVPVYTGKGIGVGVTTSGHSESYTTIWDLGTLGRVKSDNKQVFRFARAESVLYIKNKDGDIRIVGIEEPHGNE